MFATQRPKRNRIAALPGLAAAVCLLPAGPATAQVTRQETVRAADEGPSPLTLPAIQGGADQTYVLIVATRRNNDVTGVSGGGLTWTERVEQCGGRDQQGIRLWTAQGSPGASFWLTIDWDDADPRPIAAILSRYSGVGALEVPTGENTNGEAGACAGGTDSDTAQLTLTSTTDQSVHLIGVNSRNDPVISFSPGYMQIDTEQFGTGGELTILTAFDATFDPAATDTFQATTSDTNDWCTAGIVLSPAPATAVNYRSIGIAPGPLASGADASIASGTSVVTLGSGETFPATVGRGDRLDLTGGVSTIVMEESVTGGGTTTPLTLPSIQGGTDQTYVLGVATRNNVDVTNVAGGGLTWTEQVEQCGGQDTNGVRLYTAQGSPASAFQVTIDLASGDSAGAVLARYSGVDTLEDPTGENINGEGGACTGGSDNSVASLALTSTVDGSVHVIGVGPQRWNIQSVSPGYAQVGEGSGGTGQSQTKLALYDQTFATAGYQAFNANLNQGADWATAGIVLNPAAMAATTFHVLSVDGPAQATVQETAATSHTGRSYTVDRAYGTLQAWEDDRQGDLVTENRREVGVCYDDGAFTSSLLIDGSITDANHFLTLTVADGHRHLGVAGAGARIDAGGGFGARPIEIDDPYTRIEWIEVANVTDNMTGITAWENEIVLDRVLIHDVSWPGIMATGANLVVRNAILYAVDLRAGIAVSMGSATIDNCTVYNSTAQGIRAYGTTTVTIRNTIAVGNAGNDIQIDAGAVVDFADYNMYSTSSGLAPGPNDQSPPASLEDLFISTGAGFEDLHLEGAGHAAIRTGLDLSAGFAVDVDDGPRTTHWELGADELPGTPAILSWREVEP